MNLREKKRLVDLIGIAFRDDQLDLFIASEDNAGEDKYMAKLNITGAFINGDDVQLNLLESVEDVLVQIENLKNKKHEYTDDQIEVMRSMLIENAVDTTKLKSLADIIANGYKGFGFYTDTEIIESFKGHFPEYTGWDNGQEEFLIFGNIWREFCDLKFTAKHDKLVNKEWRGWVKTDRREEILGWIEECFKIPENGLDDHLRELRKNGAKLP